MAYEMKEGSFTLFPNDKKRGETDADWSGSIKLADGVEYSEVVVAQKQLHLNQWQIQQQQRKKQQKQKHKQLKRKKRLAQKCVAQSAEAVNSYQMRV